MNSFRHFYRTPWMGGGGGISQS